MIETSGEGLCCGYDSSLPVTTTYEAPFRFTGQIARAVVEVGDDPLLDAGAQTRATMTEQ